MKFILGKKIQMTQKFAEDGTVQPVTIVQAGPCVITQVKSHDKDGYTSVQIGFGEKTKQNKSLLGHLKDLPKARKLKEYRVENTDGMERGKMFDVSSFEPGDKVTVTAKAKGRGFQGVVKRHGFHGSPASHGHKDQLRMPGSIGATDPARVFKGTRMGGHMGDHTVTTANLEVVEVDVDNNLLYIKGAVPGARNGVVSIVADGEIKFVEKKPEVKTEKKEEPKAEEQTEVKEEKKDTPEEKPTEDKKKIEDKKEEEKIEEPKAEVKEEKKEAPKEEVKSEEKK